MDGTVRIFMRNRRGDTFAVLRQAAGQKEIIAATHIDPRTFCQHRLDEMSVVELADFFGTQPGDMADTEVTKAVIQMQQDRDLQAIELPCNDAVHWLADIGEKEEECAELEEEYARKKDAAKSAKDALETATKELRDLVRRATEPDATPPIIKLAEAAAPESVAEAAAVDEPRADPDPAAQDNAPNDPVTGEPPTGEDQF